MSTTSFKTAQDPPPPSDEIKTIEQIKSLIKFHKLHCMFVESPCVRPDEVPFVPGHSKYFPINKLCVYDLDENGNLLYCCDGSHLKECVSFHCLQMFRCQGKLCIITRNVNGLQQQHIIRFTIEKSERTA